jgi:hypothetical protein
LAQQAAVVLALEHGRVEVLHQTGELVL